MDKRIKFKDRDDLYLIGGDLERGGAIATRDQFLGFHESYAHLLASGDILRYGTTIGHRDEITVLGEVDLLERARA